MCGIVGILGTEPVADDIVDSLRRLEYRGYDSAGVATLEEGKLTRVRAEGKLKTLLASSPYNRCLDMPVSATHAGPPMAHRPSATPTRTRQATAQEESPSFTMVSLKTSASCATR